ncbi:hypothetical protein H9L19_03900 [Weissella diestrammenae]|uniref:Transcriptional coactivator p15 (PC4) C-terminal domain-containing protein n=1 Tax=Weissella diestrammenae TaxID=1162633 RepID=A0A7G9T7C4_9LACO|nr:PC4/YdbC family ssDNA-binding protein [Weissella diestrammenae]MCM0582012.1 hypothetical protein [Weissella diestrammenae]QNN75999.1 hypothetical protein H9L19_03900 [Weissella diestrammenae]
MAERGELKFEIIEKFGQLSTSKSGWHLELNLVKWGDNQPKFDLRSWREDHQKMGKGIGLTHAELQELQQVVNRILAGESHVVEPTALVDETAEFIPDTPQVTRLGDA